MNWLYFIIIGAIAGWISGKIMKGSGFGLLGNIAVGIIGAIIGGKVFSILGISVNSPLLGPIITAVAGAVILLALAKMFK